TPVEDYSVSSSSHRGNITPEGASAEFINTYGLETEPDDTTLTIKKLVQGMGADPDKEFRFTVYIDGTLQTFTLKHGQTKTITLPIGARYEVYEDDYSPEYSQSSLGSGYGNAAPEAIEFTQINTYTGPVSYQPEVRKTVEGDTPEQPAEFTFELTAIGNAPLPGSGTVTITGQGEAKFGEIIFFSPGIYQYTIREITGSEPGYSYDEASYILTVEVEQSGSILLVKSVEYVNSATDEVCDAAEFINGYSPPETTTVTELTGTSTAKTSETTIATTPPENISTTSTSTSTGETTSATEPSTSVKTTDPTRVTGAETTDSTKGQTTTTAPEDGQTTTGSGKRQTTTPKDGYTTANSGKRQTTTAVPNNVFTTKQTLTTAPGGGKPGGSPGGSGYPDSKPVTGDTTGSMTVWFILMIVSAFGLRWTISRLQASKASARQRR
ncbi:MAG: hypothetical protein FWE80_07615, partial [Oscillospiraceae bacterium]|nr:hypothetical protein [Oscillospiraceae bacterium]